MKYFPREPQQQRHADNVSRPAIKVPGDDDLDTTGDQLMDGGRN
jgi:hypothetical protein